MPLSQAAAPPHSFIEMVPTNMTCQTTIVPPPEAVDIGMLRQRYLHERDKRVMREATNQYVRATGEFEDVYAEDPYTPFQPREAISEDLDVAILGAGWTGLLAAYHLKNAGITNFRNIDHSGDWGGVWYWNRYPGLQCDNDAYCYLPLLEETGFMPSKKFASGYEIYDYFKLIVNKFGLGGNELFQTLVNGLRWDNSIQRWHISTDRGDDIRARHVIMANGLLNIPKLPGIPGISAFKGKMFHTSRWDYDYTGGNNRDPQLDKLSDKRVAIIGTGATAVQAVPYLGKYAKQLFVLQRTPSTVDERNNPTTDQEWVKTLKPGWQKERKKNFHRSAMEGIPAPEPDLICDIWTEITRNLSAELAAEGWPALTPAQAVARREEMDYRVMERLRARVESLVSDKATADALKPWYRYLCKRPASNDDFYPTFNRPNVKLIDVSATRGVECLTEKGFVANGVEYEIDCMIFASGYEVSSDLDRRWGIEVIEGRNGKSLYDHWRDGYTTLHGIMTRGFPNMYFTGYVQSALNASTTEQMNLHDYHIAQIIKAVMDRGATAAEPSQQAQDAWVQHMRDTAYDNSKFSRECTPSYFNGESAEKLRSYAGDVYGPGWYAYETLLQNWRDGGGLDGLELAKSVATVDAG